ncbi:protein PALS2-like [Liolophura sinensis]|uniref:protein PALS2-like n=1 Tax=Liolophura sinensis TaxID=3198878 RepID=UPI003158A225
MPAATTDTGLVAVRQVRSNLEGIGERVDADRADIAFLKKFFNDIALESLVQVHDQLEENEFLTPHRESSQLASDTLEALRHHMDNQDAEELKDLLTSPHFDALLTAHDQVAEKDFEYEPETIQLSAPFPPGIPSQTDIRVVGIRKAKTEPLGVTVKVDENMELVIARIMAGSMIDRQGLLHVGDIIREVNNQEVHTPEQLMDIVRLSPNTVTFKIIPNYDVQQYQTKVYMKTHFNYDPLKDRLIPCKEAGLPFRDGDILEILCSDDANWWQARIVDSDNPSGLIPSQTLEERRKAFVRPEYDYSKSLLCGFTRRKKKKTMYTSKQNSEFDQCEMMVYEEVTKMPPFKRKTLVLVGASGVGRRALKERLIKMEPQKFGSAMPHTSRAPRAGEEHGKGYYFTDRETMQKDIANDMYLEYGEFNGNLYGTHLDTIHEVIKSGKMCVLDVNPTSLKVLKTSEFMPFIVFLAAPSVEALRDMYEEGQRRGMTKKSASTPGAVEFKTEEDFLNTIQESADIERVYKTYFDQTIVNDNFDETYRTLKKALNEFTHETQWVPVNWVY